MVTKKTKSPSVTETVALLRDLLEAVSRPAEGSKVYAGAVEYMATILRPRFESGELRGWIDGDGESKEPTKDDPPIWRVESACERHFIRSAEAAVMVVRAASRVARSLAVPWKWNDDGAGFDLRTGASSLMAIDVLLAARSKGWSVPRPGERPAMKSTTRARACGSLTPCPPGPRPRAAQAAPRGRA